MIVVDVNRVQVSCATMNEAGTKWTSWPPGTWIYTYSTIVNGRRMDLQLAAQADKSERWVRERNDGIVLKALARAYVRATIA